MHARTVPGAIDDYNMIMQIKSLPWTDGSSAKTERYFDPVIEAYKKNVDRTLIRENLKLTVDERLQNLEAMMRDLEELRRAVGAARRMPADK